MCMSIYTYTYLWVSCHLNNGFPGGTSGKNPASRCRRLRETLVQSLSQQDPPGGGNGNPLQYSCLGNPMDRGAWQATVLGVAKSQTWLKRLSMHRYHVTKWKHQTSYLCILHLNLILTMTLQISFIWI